MKNKIISFFIGTTTVCSMLLTGCSNETVIAKGDGWALVQDNDPSERIDWSEISNASQYDFMIEEINSTCEVTQYKGDAYMFRIPPKIDGLSVTVLGKNAFSENKNMYGVYVPDGVEEIQSDCFSNSSNLSEVRLPDSLKSLSKSAFDGCRDVKITYKNKEYPYTEIDKLADLINN